MIALEAPEAWRQSRISTFDACPLSLKFDMTIPLRQLPGKMGHMGASGVLFHRFAAMALNHMRHHKERSMGVDMAMELLTKVLAQRDVPGRDVVHLPMSEVKWLRVAVSRWIWPINSLQPHEFSIERIVDVEKRLDAPLEVVGPDDTHYTRMITGQPDVLLAGPGEDEATILDWKSGWAAPSARKEPTEEDPDPDDKLSDMGYVQQVVYGWLVLKNYSSIQRVTEREVYVRQEDDNVREASVHRWQMERIEDTLAAVVSRMDAAVEEGDDSERWFPIPGAQCGVCKGRRHCPVREEFGIPDSMEDAQLLAREWHVALEIRKERTPLLKSWINEHGGVPIEIPHAKGRRVVGHKPGSNSLSIFEPRTAPESPLDAMLEEAARSAGILSDA